MVHKRLVGSVLGRLGYELRRLNKSADVTNDAFHNQQVLLSDIPVRTVFDVGAYVGGVSAEYARLFPKANIYAFEPVTEAFDKLRNRFETNSRVKPSQYAVSSKTGRMRFFVNQDTSTSSLFPTTSEAEHWTIPPTAIRSATTIDVPVTTIDAFCRQESIGQIEILKMDIQGGELRALEGARAKLEQQAILMVYAEVLFVPLYEGQAFFADIFDFLTGFDYRLEGIYNATSSENGRVKWADALFVSPRIKKPL